jgi:hypothetical protein
MKTDRQVIKLRQLLGRGMPLYRAAWKVDMDAKTARKYRQPDHLPSESLTPRSWQTREDPFQDVWPELEDLLERHPGLQAKTLFEDLQRRFPGRFPDGQLRTLQRKVKAWKAVAGPPKEVFFDQVHTPGQLGASDFTHMNDLGITLAGQPFDHMIYHFILTFSNWETGTVCFSESFESLSQGLQDALWELGGVPQMHRTDRLTAAVNNLGDRDLFQQRYRALLAHYGCGKGGRNRSWMSNWWREPFLTRAVVKRSGPPRRPPPGRCGRRGEGVANRGLSRCGRGRFGSLWDQPAAK